jgi:hypothetical protein
LLCWNPRSKRRWTRLFCDRAFARLTLESPVAAAVVAAQNTRSRFMRRRQGKRKRRASRNACFVAAGLCRPPTSADGPAGGGPGDRAVSFLCDSSNERAVSSSRANGSPHDRHSGTCSQ